MMALSKAMVRSLGTLRRTFRGYRLRPVPTVGLALKSAHGHHIPEMVGIDVYRLLKEDLRLRDIPVILISPRSPRRRAE